MANPNFKGRPKGTNKVTIEDPSLENFYITHDEWSYNLIKRNANSETTMGYYTTLQDALTRAAQYVQLGENTFTLKEYIDRLDNKLEEFNTNFNNK